MKIFFSITLLFLNIWAVMAQTSKEEMFQTIEKMGGAYYAYSTDIPTQTMAPKGYQPFYISHYGRHGSRYLLSDQDYKWVVDLFVDARDKNALTPLGLNVCNRLTEIWKEAEGHGGDLAPLGERQQRGIAERMYKSYKEVFNEDAKMTARSTVVLRCAMTMDAFCERLKELNPKLKITREASNKYMNYLNFHTEESNLFTSEKGPWREEYRKFEESHTHPDRLIASLFSDKIYVTKKVNPYALMWGFYWIAIDMQNMETPTSFYDLFQKEELFDLWQSFNYRFYVCDSNSAQNNGLMIANAKPLLSNIIESANEVIAKGNTGAAFRFGHDGNLIPLAALLQLKDCDASISEPSEFYKFWSDFKIAPMGGNIQLIFFRKKASNDVLVKFMLNEREILIPIKTDISPYYHWKDVENFCKGILI